MYIEEKELSPALSDYTCCLHDWLPYNMLDQVCLVRAIAATGPPTVSWYYIFADDDHVKFGMLTKLQDGMG